MTTRQDERARRAAEGPIVAGLPDVPGIGTALRLTPALGLHLRGLADELLVNDFAGATLRRDERELLATAVSAANDCFFCMDSHGEHALAILEREGLLEDDGLANRAALVEVVKGGGSDGFDPKMRALLAIARTVRANALSLSAADVASAKAAGASDADVQLAVLIAAAFSMYNRMVDGFRAVTPPDPAMYRERARDIAEHGYSGPPPSNAPASAGPPEPARAR